MKCIKAIKDGKYSKIGDIKRVDDLDANQKVDSGYWMFIPKSEWKLVTRKSKEELKEEVVEQTVSEKQLNRKKKSK